MLHSLGGCSKSADLPWLAFRGLVVGDLAPSLLLEPHVLRMFD